MLYVAWPVGTRARLPIGSNVRLFVRDPYGDVRADLARGFESVTTPPPDARDTGFHHGIWRLSVAGSDPNDVYMVRPSKTERWPLASPPVACA